MALQRVPSDPFGVVVTPDGRWAFVALTAAGGGRPLTAVSTHPDLAEVRARISERQGVGVFRAGRSRLPSLVRQISGRPFGEALTPDGRYLLAADGQSGAEVISVRAAEAGAKDAVVGVLSAGGRTDVGAIEVAVSRDGRYAFVSDEGSDVISVFNLSLALADKFAAGYFVGAIPTQEAPVGLAFSPAVAGCTRLARQKEQTRTSAR